MRFNEDKHLDDALQYIKSTYNQHYVGETEIQTTDVWESMGISENMCVGTALKYLMRFGKKEGKNKKDLLKAIHYIVLLMEFSDRHRETVSLGGNGGVMSTINTTLVGNGNI